MVAETTPGPGTSGIVLQIHERAAAILRQQHGKQFSFTIAGFGFSSAFCTPLVVVWAEHIPQFFYGLTAPTTIRRREILCSSAIGPHDGPVESSSPAGPQPPAPPPPPAAPSVTYSRTVSQPVLSDGQYPSRDKALRILFPGNSDSATRSKRNLYYRTVAVPVMDLPIVPLCHGSNISVTGSEERGSLGVFLAAEDDPRMCNLLTACHVLGANRAVGSTFQTVSFLDVLRELAEVLFVLKCSPQEQDEKCNAVFARVKESVATLVAEALGVDGNGWREDWAIARVAEGFARGNGDWDADTAQSKMFEDLLETGTPHDRGMIRGHAEVGDTVLKIGASTGITRGVVNGTKLYSYFQGTILPAPDPNAAIDDTRPNHPIDRTTMMTIFPESSSGPNGSFCARGDSGGGVFKFKDGHCTWVGQLVGLDQGKAGGTDVIGLMIPQEAVLTQMEKKTGKRWQLF